MLSSNSFLGSDSSSMAAGPVTPLPSHTYQGTLVDGLAADTNPSSVFNDISALMGINPLETLAQEDIDMSFQEHLATKMPVSPWDTNLLSIDSDVSMEIELHHEPGAFDRLPILATPPSRSSSYTINTIFDSSPASASPSSSFFDASTSSSTTVSPDQIYPLTPSPRVLGAPFTTPVKRERSRGTHNSALPFYPSGQTLDDEEDSDELKWSTTATCGSSFPISRSSICCSGSLINKDLPTTPEPKESISNKRTTKARKPRKSASTGAANRGASSTCVSTSVVASSTWPCTMPGCKSRFRRSEHRKRHVYSVHSDTVFWCDFCLDTKKNPADVKPFNRKDNYKQHVYKTHFTPSAKGRTDRMIDKDGSFMMDVIIRYEIDYMLSDFLALQAKKETGNVNTGRRATSGGGGGKRAKGGVRKKTGRGGSGGSLIVIEEMMEDD